VFHCAIGSTANERLAAEVTEDDRTLGLIF
jgi:hypothetical protein